MKKVLYISAFFPDRNAGHAGGRVAFENLERLGKSANVDVIVCTTEFLDLVDSGNWFFIRQGRLDLFYYLIKRFRVLSWQAIVTAAIIHTRLNLVAESKIIELLRDGGYDSIFVDFTQCLMLVDRALEISKKSIEVQACLHDVFAQRMIRSSLFVNMIMTGLVCRQEQMLVNRLRKILVLSDKDKKILESLYSVEGVEIKSFQAPFWCRNVRRIVDNVDNKKIIFFGNFDRVENSSAVKWFVANAMKELRMRVPGITLILLGAGSDRLANKLDMVDVLGTGFLEDPSEYFSKCGCAIAPLTEGAGVKFKVLEVLACGVPVVGTAVACEGIPAQSLLFHAELDSFADEIIRVLRLSGNMNAGSEV